MFLLFLLYFRSRNVHTHNLTRDQETLSVSAEENEEISN